VAVPRGFLRQHPEQPFVLVRLSVVRLPGPGLGDEHGGDPVHAFARFVVVDEAAEIPLVGADADPRLFHRFAPRGAVERFAGLQMALHDNEPGRALPRAGRRDGGRR
jgi:hypothetical protein